MSARLRLSLPALLATTLAAIISQAPAADAAADGRAPAPASHGMPGPPAARGQTRTALLPVPVAASGSASSTYDPNLADGTQPSQWHNHRFGSFGSALVGSAPVQPGPSAVAVDRATDTIYVANGFNPNGPINGGDTVSVIDGRHCSARDVSRCRGPWPTIKVGNMPSDIAVDQATDTVYVTLPAENMVAVFNGAICNSQVTSGCHQSPARVPVGLGPFGIVTDDANHTVYISNSQGANGSGSTIVSMLNSATCTAAHLGSCPTTPPPTVDVGSNPIDVDVNQATHTVYVTTFSLAHRALNGWAVFNANTCNATVQSGCTTIGRLIGYKGGPEAGVVDLVNDTLYSANFDNTLSAFDLRHCDAADLAGCATQKPGTVVVDPPPDPGIAFWLVADTPLHTVYVVNQKDDTLSAVNTSICNGSHLPACATLRPPTIHTGEDPESVAVNTSTQTIYTANQVTNNVSVINAARCNATVTRGCRQPPPAITLPGPGPLAADPAVHTAYVTAGANAVAMIDTRACNAHHLAGCAHTPAQATVGTFPTGVAANLPAHTAYVASFGSGKTGTVSVLDARTCNATHTAGCTKLPTLAVPGGHPDGIAVNTATGTLYVATITAKGPNLISVFNAATCNATTTTGCGQAPATLKVGHSAGGFSALSLAVNQATNTVYATNVITNTVPFGGHDVYVFNGATCDAAHSTGCGQAPATVNAGFNPWGIAVDQATDTIYTANIADGEHPGTASVINGATCNGTNHTGCGQHPPTVTVGFGAVAVAFDPANRTVAVANIEDTSVSVINAATCNATNTTGCHRTAPKFPVGRAPSSVTTDPAVRTIYTANGDNAVSVIPATR